MSRTLTGKYCVINSRDEFWTGIGWNTEYPEAMTFITAKAAKQAMDRQIGVEFTVISDYGFESEKAVYHQFADGIGA